MILEITEDAAKKDGALSFKNAPNSWCNNPYSASNFDYGEMLSREEYHKWLHASEDKDEIQDHLDKLHKAFNDGYNESASKWFESERQKMIKAIPSLKIGKTYIVKSFSEKHRPNGKSMRIDILYIHNGEVIVYAKKDCNSEEKVNVADSGREIIYFD